MMRLRWRWFGGRCRRRRRRSAASAVAGAVLPGMRPARCGRPRNHGGSPHIQTRSRRSSDMMKHARKWAVGGALGVALASAPLAGMAAEQWSMATAWGGGPFLKQDAEGFAKVVDTMTNGGIKIQSVPGRDARQGTQGLRYGEVERRPDRPYVDGLRLGDRQGDGDLRRDGRRPAAGGGAHLALPGGGAEMQFEYRKDQFGIASIPAASSRPRSSSTRRSGSRPWRISRA